MCPIIRLGSLVAVAMIAVLAFASSGDDGEAAFPGRNGVISFTRYSGGVADIYTLDPADPDAESVRLTNGAPTAKGAAWTSDGSRLVSDGLLIMDANGKNQHRIADLVAFNPSWSPDSSRILFGGRDGSLYVIDAEGGTPEKLVDEGAGSDDGGAAWSPDGSHIALTHRARIAFVDSAGEGLFEPAQLPDGVGPVWSPDGRCIALTSINRPDGRGLVAIATLDGSSVVVFPGVLGATDELPAWSPDGRQIAFVRSSNDAQEVYVMDVDGTNIRQLTDDPEGEQWIDWQPLPGSGEPAPCPIADASKPPVYPATDLPVGGGPPATSASRTWVIALAVALTLTGVVLVARARRG